MSDLIGQTFSRFRVVERIDGVGLAPSYKAEELESRSPVLLRVLPPEFSREERQRMMQMALAASELEHPNVETLLEIGETEEGRLFWCTRWQPGDTLDRWLGRGDIEPSDALDVAVQVARGLERSHRSRIAHGALRPDQVLLHESHRVEIFGFGLCAIAGEGLSVRLGEPLTALAYRSPEQIRGDRVGPRTDVWSLGVILYEMLAGRRPFEGSTVGALAEGILGSSPPSISKVCSAAPKGLHRVLTRALAKEVGARFSGIAELGQELLPLAAKLGEPARRTRFPNRPPEPEPMAPEAPPVADTAPSAEVPSTETPSVEVPSVEVPSVEAPDTVAEEAAEPDEDQAMASPEPAAPEVPLPTVRWVLTAVGLLILLAVLARLIGVF